MKTLLSSANAYRLVKNEAEKGALSHAYLLIFPDGKNMRAALKEFAKLILRADGRKARLIDNESFCDCEIYPEEGKRLASDHAAKILSSCQIRPVEGEEKLFVLERFEDANASVQNKLLKVLEEPPAGVRFLLGATSEFAVLPTVKSRVRKIEIPPFSEEQIESFLSRNYPAAADIADCAAASGGIAGEAENLLGGEYYPALVSFAVGFAAAEEADFPALSQKISSVSQKGEFLSVLRLVFRDLLLYNLGEQSYALLKGQGEKLKPLAARYSGKALVSCLELVAKAEREMKFNANFTLLVQTLFIGVTKERTGADARRYQEVTG